jgi:DNA-binding winged helix-turn-helix (wHTH) protein/TolB-like protein/tetratricopeptide (TPR) repeat protein
MDTLSQALAPTSRIDLAREADFRLGPLLIRPSRREVEGGGERHVLQRRVMQVLVALAHSTNQVVSQHELILRCWDGLSVSDDAIGRCIAQLRRVATSWAEPPFEIKTIAGVGYRLEPQTPSAVVAGSSRRRWTALALLAALAMLVIAAALVLPLRERLPGYQPRYDSHVAVLPFDAIGPGSGSFASGLADKIVGALSDSQVQAIPEGDSRGLRGAQRDSGIERLGVGLLLEGAVQSDGKAIHVRLHLDDARERVVVWSDEFQGPASDPAALQTMIAAHAADVAYWGGVGRSGRVRLDASTLAAFIAGRESTTGVRRGSNAAALADYQRVVAASPDFSWGYSASAVAEAFELTDGEGPPEALRAAARRDATRALALDPHNGEAYLALELAAPRLDWRDREVLLLQGNAADQGFEPGALMEGRLQWSVGRGRAALTWLARAHDINPLHNGANWTLAVNLASEGRVEESRALLAQMKAQWPENTGTKLARFFVPVVLGENREALALLDDPAARPPSMDQRATAAWRATLEAVDTPGAAQGREAGEEVKQAAAAGSIDRGQALLLLSMLGNVDDAFAQAQLYMPADPYVLPYLFLPRAAPLRSDRRFMSLARRLGFVEYWTSTGRWPDFCSEPGLPYDCKAEAARGAAKASP